MLIFSIILQEAENGTGSLLKHEYYSRIINPLNTSVTLI